MTILAVTGLRREARIADGADIRAVVGGGNSKKLRQRLLQALDFGAEAIISFGIAGGLMPTLVAGDCVIASAIIVAGQTFPTHDGWTASLAELLPFAHVRPIAGADEIATDAATKATLYRSTGAAAVDMESHIAAELAAARNLPFAALRAISDSAATTLPPAVGNALAENGSTDFGAVLRAVIGDPKQIPALIRTGYEAEKAFRALLRCRRLLGPRLGAMDFGQLSLHMG